jgi:hypothetical protein
MTTNKNEERRMTNEFMKWSHGDDDDDDDDYDDYDDDMKWDETMYHTHNTNKHTRLTTTSLRKRRERENI